MRRLFVKTVTIYTDGACLGNGQQGLGYGGWGAVVMDNTSMKTKEISGSAGPNTTNQVMELTAILRGIQQLAGKVPEDSTVTVCSDSQYAIKGITEWSPNWIRNGWVNSSGKAVANKALWQELLGVINDSPLNIEFNWVKGHAGHYFNSLCDLLATSAAAQQAKDCGCKMFENEMPTY